ncbi:hypothetical protein SCP_1503220 [Sparassis crispa]|uniref:F-box domain-containing protein n=1 Tax=Sparassis crispa TaxID=139825 RepID=A0A401H4H1_9APHY|nr:hypothetical protein SCP_1503220 [Sparassis crispa]GBE89314.1 hypothetical protein SCP_1503220 [Sparassis crispa]
MPRIPLEVAELIIDYLWDDWFSLHNCADAYHAWLPRAQHHLFAQKHIVSQGQFEAFVRASDDPFSKDDLHLDAVRTLNLSGWVSRTETSSKARTVWMYQAPLRLGRMLPAVQTLNLSLLNWSGITPPPDHLAVGFATFHNVVKLELTYCTFRDVFQFHSVVSAFPRLDNLALCGIEPWARESSLSKNRSTSSQLDARRRRPLLITLSIRDYKDDVLLQLVNWFLCTLSVLSLRRLELLVPSRREVEEYARKLIEAVAPQLQHLELHDDDAQHSAAYHSNARYTLFREVVPYCTALRTIHLPSPRFRFRPFHDLHLILPTCRIQTLTLEFRGMDAQWDTAREVLALEQFSQLKEVILKFSDQTYPVDYRDQWRPGLIKFVVHLRQRGVRVDLWVNERPVLLRDI